MYFVHLGAGRVQNAASAASAMAYITSYLPQQTSALHDAATCPEHRATIKLNSGVFEVVALARCEKRGCVGCRGGDSCAGQLLQLG
jgi:hypothetical protein